MVLNYLSLKVASTGRYVKLVRDMVLCAYDMCDVYTYVMFVCVIKD